MASSLHASLLQLPRTCFGPAVKRATGGPAFLRCSVHPAARTRRSPGKAPTTAVCGPPERSTVVEGPADELAAGPRFDIPPSHSQGAGAQLSRVGLLHAPTLPIGFHTFSRAAEWTPATLPGSSNAASRRRTQPPRGAGALDNGVPLHYQQLPDVVVTPTRDLRQRSLPGVVGGCTSYYLASGLAAAAARAWSRWPRTRQRPPGLRWRRLRAPGWCGLAARVAASARAAATRRAAAAGGGVSRAVFPSPLGCCIPARLRVTPVPSSTLFAASTLRFALAGCGRCHR